MDEHEDWIEETPRRSRPKRRGSGMAGQMLMAAMLGLVDALGWERPPSAVVQLAPDLNTGDLDLAFGDLPPFD